MASRNPDSVKQTTIAATNHFYSINLRYIYKKFQFNRKFLLFCVTVQVKTSETWFYKSLPKVGQKFSKGNQKEVLQSLQDRNRP